ncbi:MAG TPA: hypothetical protein PLB62_11865, partial [Candidatus Sumerlaeota bacterium]|nr:hypothetical protein [Candidatus Sumerlaeota bacterium]
MQLPVHPHRLRQLAEAAADFNSVAGGCTSDWNLWIITDLTEPANVAFGNTVPSNFTVTVRPLAGIEPKVTFTQETVGALPGHLVIGASDLATTASIIKTDNFIINGFADDADTTRSITFLNRNDVAIADSRLILVIGDSDNIAIRNCNLINASQSNAENGCTAVGFMSWNDGILNNIPDQGIVENCVITAQGGSSVTGRYGIGVSQSALGTIGAGVAQTGLVVNGCEINARYAGILLGQAKGATIQDNTIRLNQFAPGTHIRGIWLESENMTSGWILDVFNNTINELVNVDTGITAIDLDDTEYSAEHTAITMNVFNNMICGFEFTAAAPANDVIYRGIYCDRGSDFVAPVTFNCFFNSIYMPGFANLTYTAGNPTGQNAAFAIGAPAGDSVRTLDVRNNIIRLEQNYAAAINYKSNLDKTLFIGNYNDLSVNTTAGAFTGRYTDFTSLTEYAELADWRNSAGNPEAAGVSVDPFIASPPFIGTWTAPDNLLFTTYHSSALIGTPIAGITTDIRGTVRNATRPYMGCDEHYFSGRPSVVITVNPPAVNEESVPVSFNIVALDSIPSTIMVEYSINGGTAWTPTTNFTGDSTGLAASPAGVEHSITWNPIDDLGEVDANCLLRISARADLSPGEWGDPGVTSEFAVNNARSYPVIHYPSPATDGWVKSYGTLADGTFINAVDGAFYIATHSSASGQVSVGAGTGATDTRNMAGGWQSPNTDIPYLENTVYIARFKVSTNQASLNNVPNTRLYAEFINSAGSLAVAGGTRVGRGPFAPNASGNTYSVYIQGASSMSPDIEYVRLKFEVI